ncbi:MAG: class I SAM-dependent methyltransferase [Nanoarchaeota archaeon]|nr:class I SAM-dependent methyltransferase [Nanoarchaeota archaeon]
MEFKLEEPMGFQKRLVTPDESYMLIYFPMVDSKRRHFRFFHFPDLPESHKNIVIQESRMAGEHQNIKYPSKVNQCLELPPESCVIDVGCGYGQLLPFLHKARPDLQLIGIDLADFSLMGNMLESMAQYIFPKHKEELERLVETGNFILSDDITFINKELSKAIKQTPNLVGSADVIVDHMGAVAYAGYFDRERPSMLQLEQRLLAPQGVLINQYAS